MVSGDESTQSSKQAETQPPEYGSRDAEAPKFREGLYVVTNQTARTVLDLSTADVGSRSHCYQRTDSQYLGNQLWLIQRKGLNATFTLKNFKHNNVLEVTTGGSQSESYVTGQPRVFSEENRLSQEWLIVEHAPRQYTVQCVQTKKFLELPKGNPTNGTHVTCTEASEDRDHQIWDLERVSRSSVEVKAIIERWKPELLPRILQPYEDAAEYFVLERELRKSIWEKTNLRQQRLHQHMFDYDDFVVKAKEAVRAWARDNFPNVTRGYSVLFGVIYGEANKVPKAYNWYLTPDMSALLFFDAQTSREYTPEALDGFGFEPTFATF